VPEGREDAVERPVLEGELLGVAFHPLDLEPFAYRLRPPLLEQFGNEVEPGYLRAGACGRNRGVPRAACDVEHGHSRLDRRARGDKLAHVGNALGESRVVPRVPGRALPRLELV
jgi:hypothetical protein